MKFNRVLHFSLSTGLALGVQAVLAANIVVGQVAPLSGMEANQGRAYAEGVELYFNHVNRSGGIGGNQFVLVRRDDGGRPADTVALTEELLAQNQPLVLTGYFGSANLSELIASNALQSSKISLVGYRTSDIRDEVPCLYSVRAGLGEELDKIAKHLGTIGITRLGLFYEDGPGAAATVSAMDGAAAKANAKVIVRGSYAQGTTRVLPAVEQFLKASPQAILLVASGAAAAGFIEQYRTGGGSAQIFTHADADVEQMAKRLSDDQLKGVAIAQVTPNPYDISTRVANELNGALAESGKRDVPVSYSMMEGFIAAKVIVEAVRRQGHVPSREGTAAALNAMNNYDAGGYVISFSPGMHTGSRHVELSIVSGTGKIRQ
jgi:ABC-type branched-subunit amino acid transport system substrate-binding protein